MIEDEEPLFTAGHNSATLSPESAAEMMRDALAVHAERRDAFVRSANNGVARDRNTAGDAADVIRLAGQAFDNVIKPLYLAERAPYDQAIAAVKREAEEFWQPVFDAVAGLRQRVEAWDLAEKKRIDDQRVEQAAEMEKMRAATAAPAPAPVETPQAKRAPVRGMLGGKVTQVAKRNYQIVDLKLVPDWIMQAETVKEAILKVCARMGRNYTEIPGILIQDGEKTRIG